MKRQRIGLGILLVSALVAAACSDPPTAGSGDEVEAGDDGAGEDEEATLPECPLEALDEADGPVEVTLWYGGIGGETKDTMENMVANFNRSQDQVRVTASDQGGSYEQVFRKFESAASADPGQLPDVVLLEDTQLQALADGGLVLPAQACMEASGYEVTDIEPAVRSSWSVDDVLYPGYANVTTPVLYYNKAHWAQAGLDPNAPPETLDEIQEHAQALKDAGVSEKPLSFKVSHNVFTNWLAGEGVDVVDNGNGREGLATEATFDTPEAQAFLEQLKQMNDAGLLNVFAETEGGVDHYLALATEDSSMLIETSGAAVNLAAALGGELTAEELGQDIDIDVDPSDVDQAALLPGTAPFPGIASSGQVYPGGGGFFMVNTGAPAEQAGGWRFLEFMLQPANAEAWHMNGSYLPIVKSVQDEAGVQAFWADEVAGVLLKPGVDQLSDADPDEPGPLIGPYPDYVDAVQGAIESVLLGGADVDSALAGAQEEVTASLERYAQE